MTKKSTYTRKTKQRILEIKNLFIKKMWYLWEKITQISKLNENKFNILKY